MKRCFRIIKDNIQSVFSIGNLFCITIIFIYVFAVNFNSIRDIDNFWQVVNMLFRGPNNLTDNIIEVFKWGGYQIFLLYMVGNYCFRELDTRSIYTIARLGNKQKWHICLQVTCFFVCIIYFVFGTSMVFIYTSVMNAGINLNSIGKVFETIGLLSLSSYYMVTVYFFTIIVSRKHNLSFLVLITILYSSITLGNVFNIDKFIPFNQGILSKHIVSNFSYRWSFIFLAILISLNLIVINRLIIKRDLFEITH